ncbi:MAG: hypothetical protein JRN39_00160 [Nitrososphaerota archaeon]|nr:hypothetical protein [Nitrososphaerota archaeon]MDG6938809.1 hypothetical protein [Nitrososphaerota archaeon]
MKLAAAVSGEGKLAAINEGERIALIDEGSGNVDFVANPGFGRAHGGKEKAMETILGLKAEGVVVKEGYLCPCSYEMSVGKVKYVVAQEGTLDSILKGRSRVLEELDESMYAEPEGHHHHRAPRPNVSISTK